MIDRAMIDQTCALHTERLSRRASSQIEPHGGKRVIWRRTRLKAQVRPSSRDAAIKRHQSLLLQGAPALPLSGIVAAKPSESAERRRHGDGLPAVPYVPRRLCTASHYHRPCRQPEAKAMADDA
jgi:hypothetical protein